MDSIKLSERPRAHAKIRNSATNTEPIRCGFCGSGAYVLACTQPSNLRNFCPGSPKCKPATDKCNDNFSIHQPLFSSPSLLQPIFSNIFVPPSISSSATPSTQLLEQEMPLRRPISTLNFKFYHSTPTDAKPNKAECYKTQEKVPVAEHEKEQCHSIPCSIPSPCDCTNPFPWTCSPLIVPLLSYYVLWNSQILNGKLPGNPFLQCDSETSKATGDDEAGHRKMNRNACKKKGDEFWSTSEKVERDEWRNGHDIAGGSSTSFVSVTSLDYGEETFLNTRKKNEGHKPVKNKLDDSPLSNESTERINLDKKYQRQKAPDSKMSTECQTVDNLCKSYKDKQYMPSSISMSSSDEHYELTTSDSNKVYVEKIQNGKRESTTLDIRIGTVDITYEEEYSSSQQPQEKIQDSKEKTTGKQKPRDRTAKKCIKNFTMADEIQYQYQKSGDKNFSAAGGDLGGNCGGYKVNISSVKMSQDETCLSDEKDEENTISGQNVEEISDREKITSPREEEEIKKISRSNTRSWSNSKSRIAKLAPNYKSKDVGTLTMQTSGRQQQQQETQEPQLRHGEGTFTKKKHNCLVMENTTDNESNFKIKNIENCEPVQNQNGGSNKKNSKNKAKNRSNKREGKKSKSENPSQNSRSEEDSLPGSPLTQ